MGLFGLDGYLEGHEGGQGEAGGDGEDLRSHHVLPTRCDVCQCWTQQGGDSFNQTSDPGRKKAIQPPPSFAAYPSP